MAKRGGGGSGVLVAALVLIVLAIVGGGGYYVLSARNVAPVADEATSTPGATRAAAAGTAVAGANATATAAAKAAAGTATAAPKTTASPRATNAATATPKPTVKASPTKSSGTPSGGGDIGGTWEGTLLLTSVTLAGTPVVEGLATPAPEPVKMTFKASSASGGTVTFEADGKAEDPASYTYRNGQVDFTLVMTDEGSSGTGAFTGNVSRKGSDFVIGGTFKLTGEAKLESGKVTFVVEGTWSVTKTS